MNYSEKLRDPRWQKRRLEIFLRDNFACVRCKSKTITLHVHHKRYFPNTNPWDYDDSIMETLCENCHKAEHNLIPDIEPERKYEHLIIYKTEPDVITSINQQISELTNKLKEEISNDLMEDILKNIMFLNDAKLKFTRNG